MSNQPTVKTYRPDTEETCHCGANYNGSDHCPHCYCEKFEGDCVTDYNADICAAMSTEYLATQMKYMSVEMEKRVKGTLNKHNI